MRRSRTAIAIVAVTALLTAGTALVVPAGAASADDEVTLNALFFSEGADGPEGGTNQFTVRYEPSGNKGFRVAFSEDEVSGTGDQWRAAGWNAAAVATILTGAALEGAEVTFDVSGRIDGPSAGALMTIGLLSLIRGDTIKKDVTMTGTINPDGTIGPVGGIPYKIDGVEAAKKTRMLIPVGQRNSADNDGNLVDMVREGNIRDIDVSEVADIYEAYKAFTGKTLPRPQPADVELPNKTYNAIAAKVKGLQADFQASATEFTAIDPAIQSELGSLAVDADAAAARAQELSDNGLQAGAYNSALEAAALANAAVSTGQALQVYFSQGTDAFIEQIRSSTAVSGKVEAFVDDLRNVTPQRVSDASVLIEGYSGAIDALSLTSFADNIFDQAEFATTEEELLSAILVGAVYYEIAGSLIAGAEDIVDVGEGAGGAKIAKGVKLKGVSDFFRKAAEANLTAFDTLILEPAANANGANAEQFKADFASTDLDYALAQASVGVLEGGLDDYIGDDKTAPYARLGGAVSLYTRTAGLLSKYYSLDAQLDDSGNVVGVGNERALVSALAFGSEQVERSVGQLQQRKVQAPLIVAGYESAGVSREGDASDKLDALGSYLGGFTEARVLAYLGGFEKAGFATK